MNKNHGVANRQKSTEISYQSNALNQQVYDIYKDDLRNDRNMVNQNTNLENLLNDRPFENQSRASGPTSGDNRSNGASTAFGRLQIPQHNVPMRDVASRADNMRDGHLNVPKYLPVMNNKRLDQFSSYQTTPQGEKFERRCFLLFAGTDIQKGSAFSMQTSLQQSDNPK